MLALLHLQIIMTRTKAIGVHVMDSKSEKDQGFDENESLYKVRIGMETARCV